MNKIINHCKTALPLFLIFTIITGVIYPLLITGLAQILFEHKSNGSLIVKDQKIVGSELIGQFFNDPKHFLSRPSATQDFPYNSMYSGGSNWGPTNVLLINKVNTRIKELKKIDQNNILAIPTDLVTASGSGLDPHISTAAAFYQAARISKLRNLSKNVIDDLINKYTEKPQFGFLGESRVNVLKLNLALNCIDKSE